MISYSLWVAFLNCEIVVRLAVTISSDMLEYVENRFIDTRNRGESMKAAWQIVKTLGVYAFVMLTILLLVLFPRLPETSQEIIELPDGRKIEATITSSSTYSVERHWNVIKDYFTSVIENKSLGTTRYNVSAESEIIASMKSSITIIIAALVFSFSFGIMKGFFDFKMQRKKLNIFGHWTTWVFQSIPDFVVILFVQLLLIRYLPITQFFSREGWDAFILPSLLVAIFPTMYIARITSAAISGQVGQLYIQVARAKGMSERVVLYKHVFRNIIGTILTHLSSLMVYILSNLLMVEFFMNYPGATLRLFRAIDYSPSYGTGPRFEPGVIIGITFCFMILIMLVHFISQLARRYFEPRMGENVG